MEKGNTGTRRQLGLMDYLDIEETEGGDWSNGVLHQNMCLDARDHRDINCMPSCDWPN